MPSSVTIVQADISDQNDRMKIVSSLEDNKLNFLVHNAAVLDPIGSLTEMKLESWRNHLSINLDGPVFLTQALLPCFAKESRILHISSGAAHQAIQGWAAYCVSKAALHMSYLCWKDELAGQGILVGSARPGIVDTPMQELIREQRAHDFPRVEEFKEMKANNQLFPVDKVGQFLKWLLLYASPEKFSGDELDIRDESILKEWDTST